MGSKATGYTLLCYTSVGTQKIRMIKQAEEDAIRSFIGHKVVGSPIDSRACASDCGFRTGGHNVHFPLAMRPSELARAVWPDLHLPLRF